MVIHTDTYKNTDHIQCLEGYYNCKVGGVVKCLHASYLFSVNSRQVVYKQVFASCGL